MRRSCRPRRASVIAPKIATRIVAKQAAQKIHRADGGAELIRRHGVLQRHAGQRRERAEADAEHREQNFETPDVERAHAYQASTATAIAAEPSPISGTIL